MDEFLPILGFGIGGYRSFGEEVQRIGPCGKINLLIGQNNSGKSNILRFLHDNYRLLRPAAAPFALVELDLHRSLNRLPSFAIAIRAPDNSVRDRWNQMSLPVLDTLLDRLDPCQLGYWIDLEIVQGKNVLQASNRMVEIVKATCGSGQSLAQRLSRILNRATVQISDDRNARDLINDLWANGMAVPEFLMIPAFRRPGVEVYDQKKLDGEDLVHRLARLQHPPWNQQNLKEDFKRIEQFLQVVTDRKDARLEIPNDKDTVVVHMHNRALPLSALGTGIQEVVILAAVATVVRHKVICIEEPEIHLHPVLQRKLIRYLDQETENQYFIATHSAHILDRQSTAVFHIRLENGSSLVNVAAASYERFSICQDLGYQASDLLQTNCVIWVEGPSDRLYIQAWIRLLRPKLEEGTDYVIMFYGGRLLNHLTFDDPEVSDFISLRKLNRNSCVIIDSDKSTPGSRINATKRRVRDEWGPHSGFAWVTEGREIENYVEPEAMLEALKAVAPRTRHVLAEDKCSQQIRRAAGGHPVADKIKVARWLIQENRLTLDRMDLRTRIDQLCAFIDTANHVTSVNQ